MAKGINISVAQDSRDFASATQKNLIDPLDDAATALDKLDRTDLNTLDRTMRDAQKATEQNESEYKKLGDVIRQTSRQSTSDFELDSREKRKLSRETIKEIGDEAKQNASETFSSFDGSAQSFVDGIQGTLGGLVSSMGPVGLAIGSAGALGIGLINGALQKADQDSQEFRQHVSDLTAALIEAGVKGEIPIDTIAQGLQKLATETDTNKANLVQLFDLAGRTGTSYKDLAQAYAGSETQLKKLLDTAKEKLKVDLADYEAQTRSGAKAIGPEQQRALKLAEQRLDAQKQIVAYLDSSSSAAEKAAKNDDLYAKAGGPELEIKSQLLDALASGYDDVRSSAAQAATAEDGAFDVNKYLAQVDAGKQALAGLRDNLSKIKLTPDEWKNFLGLDEQTQEALASAYTSGDSALQQRIRDSLSDSGGKAGADATVKFSESFKPAAKDSVKVQVDTTAAEGKVDKLTKDRDVKLTVKTAGEKAARDTLDDIARDRSSSIHVGLAAGTAAATRNALQSYLDSHPLVISATVNGKRLP